MNTKPYDQAFKYIAEEDAESLLILLGHLKPGEQATIERLPLELSVSTIATDQTYRVTTHGESLIVHPEAQLKWEGDVPEIVTEYDARLWMTHRLPVVNYVLVFTRKGFPKRQPRYGIVKAGALEIRTRLKIVKVWELPAKHFLRLQRQAILPFIPLMNGGKPELATTAQLLREIGDRRKRLDLGIHFLMLGGLRYNRSDLLSMILEKSMIPLEQLKESSFYQYILDEGRAEGRAEGEAKAAADALLMLVAKRFPKLDITREVAKIHDAAALRQLFADALEVKTAATLRKHIKKFIK